MPEPSMPPFTPLDEEGPALPLSATQAQTQANLIVGMALKRKRRRTGMVWMIAVALVSSTAFALWLSTSPEPKAAPAKTVRSVVQPTVSPEAESARKTVETVPQEGVTPPVEDAGAARRASRVSLQDLLGLANRARGVHDFRRAEQLYRSVAKRFPGTDDAYAALVAAGDLNREKLGNPQAAMRSYSSALALRNTGALHEQALAGLALSAETLRDRDTETQAWRELLQKHPTSLHAPHAKGRLTLLAPTP